MDRQTISKVRKSIKFECVPFCRSKDYKQKRLEWKKRRKLELKELKGV